MKRPLARLCLPTLLFVSFCISSTQADDPAKTMQLKVGIIGLDTSHVIAFTKILNAPEAKPDVAGCRVVAAYPKGSPDIESSVSRIPRYTAEIQKLGVEIMPSIDSLLKKVDCVLLETNDGRPHLKQALQVISAGKPLFIDKPVAASLSDAVAIFATANKAGVPVFSSSSLRYGKLTQAVRVGAIGSVRYCETYSPCSLEKTHPDLFWYGIHGVESLFAAMGTGCESVRRTTTPQGKIQVTGTWSRGRMGVYREGKGYGGTARGTMGESPVGAYDGYRPLLVEIVKFFRTGKPPVSAEETLEIYAFMEAADESKRLGGQPVELEKVFERARKAAAKSLD